MINPLDYIRRHREATIVLPVGEEDTLQLECKTTLIDDSTIEVEVLPEKINGAELDPTGPFILFFDSPDTIICLLTTVTEIGKESLQLEILEVANRAQKRRFFRVPTTVPVDLQAQHDKGVLTLNGKTLNISACGVLVAFPKPLKYQRRVWMEICLPEPISREIRCIAQVIRLDEKKDGRYVSAFSFDRVRQSDQEALITFCLEEQRRQLRLKVKIGW